jgi:hypothetical protein
MIKNELYIKLVEVKHLCIQKQPATLSILEKRDRVKALNEARNEVLGCHTSCFYSASK